MTGRTKYMTNYCKTAVFPPIGGHFRVCPISRQTMLNIQLTPTRTLQTRVTEASADGGGVYTIAELAVVDTVSDQEYVTSVGGSYRRDEMSKEVKTIREGINAARRVAIKELNEATEKTVINAQATPVKETVTV